MKKMMTLLLALSLVLAFSACGQSSAGPAVESPEADTGENVMSSHSDDAKVLVAYFSQTGNTRPLAEHAAELLHPDTYQKLVFLLTLLRDRGQERLYAFLRRVVLKEVPFDQWAQREKELK